MAILLLGIFSVGDSVMPQRSVESIEIRGRDGVELGCCVKLPLGPIWDPWLLR